MVGVLGDLLRAIGGDIHPLDGITEEKHIPAPRKVQIDWPRARHRGPWWAAAAAVIGGMGGWLKIVTCVLGMLAAFCFQLSHDLIDGWLAITMPISAFVGTALGLVVGVVARLVARTVCFLFTRR